MRRDAFLAALRRVCRVVPFKPFTVELVNRTRIVSRHPEAIRVEDGLAVYAEEVAGAYQYFDASSVARVVTGEVPPGAA
ncbi:MAG: hypothetical protein C0501_06865 [Isosphaera sp.]|nr:hypothetical protein [Isosphaera sp.]